MTATGKYLNLTVDPFLVYPGAKWSMAEWIISHMPEHKIYLEPFAGSGAVFFNKQPSDIETLNDINGDIVNLFHVMREHLDELLFAIELTPWSRNEFDQASSSSLNLSDVERARRFLVRCWQAHKPKMGQKTGWKKEGTGKARKNYTRQWTRLPARIRLAAERLKDAQIENRDALDIIKRHCTENVLIYADPPYLLSTRTPGLYQQEMHLVEHEAMLKLLQRHPGPVMLSSLHHQLYEDRLTGWEKKTIKVNTCSGRPNTEILWLNPQAAASIEKKEQVA